VQASDRARWLADLSQALRDAQQLLFELDLSTCRAEAGELFHRIEAAQFEVRQLQVIRSADPRGAKDPKWTNVTPWPCETQVRR
jgi:hypothetical protein